MGKIKVSVIIPVYKVETYLAECMESIFRQSLKEIEIIAVDDGSPDNSGKMLDEYAAIHSNLSVIHKKNAGVSAARNDGIEKSAGEYLYIMDSDDWLEPEALQRMYECVREQDADVVITDHYMFRNGTTEQRETHFFSQEFTEKDKKRIQQLANMVLYPTFSPYPTAENTGLGLAAPWTKLVKRELVISSGLRFDPSVRGLFDDGLFALEVFSHASCVAYIRYGAYHYRELDTSLMRGYNSNRVIINETVFFRIREFIQANPDIEKTKDAYRGRVLLYLRYVFTAFLFHDRFEGTWKERKEKFFAVLHKSSYRNAALEADLSMLRPNERKLAVIVKHPLAARLFFWYKMWRR